MNLLHLEFLLVFTGFVSIIPYLFLSGSRNQLFDIMQCKYKRELGKCKYWTISARQESLEFAEKLRKRRKERMKVDFALVQQFDHNNQCCIDSVQKNV